jgi:hypothetical protein
MNKDEASQYWPKKNLDGRATEDVRTYVARMHSTLLPHFPEELLVEWLYRHHKFLYTYAFLLECLRFERQTWKLDEIPGREAFVDERLCDAIVGSFRNSARDPTDWLAQSMDRKGTWEKPVVLLENMRGDIESPDGVKFKQPYHLLEGHRRLSFLIALRNKGRALAEHDLWVARKLL